MSRYVYEIWRARLDSLSEWYGGSGEIVAIDLDYREAKRAVANYQKDGDAAWMVRVKV